MYGYHFLPLTLYLFRPKELKFPRSQLIPKKGLVYDHVFIRKQYGSWNPWSNLVQPVNIDEKAQVEYIDDFLKTIIII